MAPHSSTLAWKIPWTEEPGRLQSMGSLRVGMTERLHFRFSLSCIGEGNGIPLQYSCLENPRDRGAWWAAVYGVTQSRTWLKRLRSSILTSLLMSFILFTLLCDWEKLVPGVEWSSMTFSWIFFIFKINFHCNVYSLWCCISFYCMAKWISQAYTHVC